MFPISLFVLPIMMPVTPGDALPRSITESCVTCHSAMRSARLSDPVRAYADDVHAALGFGCSACHGGDPSVMGMASMDTGSGFIGKPDRLRTLAVCGRCHSDRQFMSQYDPDAPTDQLAQYRTSIHGVRLLEQADTNVAICSSCHRIHSIRSASDPLSRVSPLNLPQTCGECHSSDIRMKPYEISVEQVREYQTSIHWKNLSEDGDRESPVCNDCHGNHGAAPPGVAWVGNVCGQCHSAIADYFAESRHAQIFPLMGRPGCPACHNNHAISETSDEWLGLGEGSLCRSCHVAGTVSGDRVLEFRTRIDSLRNGVELAAAILDSAETAGMEVSQSQVDLSHAHTALLNARAAFHSLNLDSVSAQVTAGLAISDAAFARGVEALRELRSRRLWLGGLIPIIMLVIAGLIMKIRQMEALQEKDSPSIVAHKGEP